MGTDVKFGTSGVRGPSHALLAGQAAVYAASFLECMAQTEPSSRRVLIGRDLRESSDAIASIVSAIASSHEFEAHYCGALPTPALAMAAARHEACAVMVTGSHIPADRNGLKFYSYRGEIGKPEEAEIVARAGAVDMPAGGAPAQLNRNLQMEALRGWHDRYAGLAGRRALMDMRVGLYAGSSVAAMSLEKLLRAFGANVVVFGRNSTFRPLDTEAVEEAVLEVCRDRVTDEMLDCVVSTDPDGDRPLLLDEHGDVVRGDLLGWMTALWLGADHVSTTVNANSRIAESDDGPAVTRTRIGSPFVIESIEAAIRQGARLAAGFEPNGGFLLGGDCVVDERPLDRLMTRDSFLPIVSTLLQLADSGQSMSALAATHGFHSALSDRLANIDPRRSGAFLQRIGNEDSARIDFFGSYGEVISIDRTDGLRVAVRPGRMAPDGPLAEAHSWERNSRGVPEWIIHLRASGNAPEFRCYVEAGTQACASAVLAVCMAQLERELRG